MRRFLFVACCVTSLLSADGKSIAPSRPSCFPLTGELSIAMDTFRSLPEGSWGDSTGALAELHLSLALPADWSIQAGGSYGAYDWAGRLSTPFGNPKAFAQQGFVTGAVARASTIASKWHAGLSYDWMFTKQFGEFAKDPTLSQARGQLGYLFRGGNEFGAWATINTNTAHSLTRQIPLRFRAISQANLFWCHYFANQAYTMLWAGTPYRQGLMYSSGRPGNYLFGARFSAPLSAALSITGHASYMGARSAPRGIESKNYATNFYLALTYAFGQCRRAPTPYMTTADNSTFIVDTNYNH